MDIIKALNNKSTGPCSIPLKIIIDNFRYYNYPTNMLFN